MTPSLDDIGVDAVKTGMLSTPPIIAAVADRVRRYGIRKLVVDPVMIAKSGHALLLPEAQAAVRELLLPLARVVTPNLPEAEALTGMAIRPRANMEAAGRRLLQIGVAGGRGEGRPRPRAASRPPTCSSPPTAASSG